jgi:hypothetical protein
MHLFLRFILEMKLYMFRTVPLSIIRSFSLYTQQWYMSYWFAHRVIDPWVKQPRRRADRSPPSNYEVKTKLYYILIDISGKY